MCKKITNVNEFDSNMDFKILVDRLLLVSIVVLSLIYFYLVPKLNINWDEFLYLSNIYDYKNGRELSVFQTFYIHFFRWLTYIPGYEVNQIIAARYVYLTIFFLCLAIIYKISSNHFSKTGGLFSIFLTLTFTDILRHSFSFRADLLCFFFFLVGIYFLLNNDIYTAVIASFSFSICFLISIKSAFYIPVIISLLFSNFIRNNNNRYSSKLSFIFILFSILIVSLLYLYHSIMLADNDYKISDKILEGSAIISDAGSKVLWTGKFFPQSAFLIRSISENFITWYVISFSLIIILKNISSLLYRPQLILLLSLSFPLLTLIFYRNSFPYFFVSFLPATLIISNLYIDYTFFRFKQERKAFPLFVIITPILLCIINVGSFMKNELHDQTVSQRELIDTVHNIFPEPVPYIDRNRMISSFPNVGFFMSSWGIEKYRDGNMPIMKSILEIKQPIFLIANTPVLKIDDEKLYGENKSIYKLFDEDYMILKNNFIHHWGPLFVAGKCFKGLMKNECRTFNILIAGKYTIESDGYIRIDNKLTSPGDVIYLSNSTHSVVNIDAHKMILRWGSHLYVPNKNSSSKALYTGL